MNNKKIIKTLISWNIIFIIFSLVNGYMSYIASPKLYSQEKIVQARTNVFESEDINFLKNGQQKSFDYIESIHKVIHSQQSLINMLIQVSFVIASLNVFFLFWLWKKNKSKVNNSIETDRESSLFWFLLLSATWRLMAVVLRKQRRQRENNPVCFCYAGTYC
jgi:hypothetical protein